MKKIFYLGFITVCLVSLSQAEIKYASPRDDRSRIGSGLGIPIYGIDNLRIVNMSSMPLTIGNNTQLGGIMRDDPQRPR